MSYHVVFSAQAKKSIKKLDRHVYTTIIAWIRKTSKDAVIHGFMENH